ncbi:hypothetical protein [Megasphaera sp.]|uniref:hypothetical protein n=1 Tax=Megasphaera sp. TaxID=2023260 RepID=UPI0027B972AA|nr:hypothetical protein [Megasphaera sp.]
MKKQKYMELYLSFFNEMMDERIETYLRDHSVELKALLVDGEPEVSKEEYEKLKAEYEKKMEVHQKLKNDYQELEEAYLQGQSNCRNLEGECRRLEALCQDRQSEVRTLKRKLDELQEDCEEQNQVLKNVQQQLINREQDYRQVVKKWQEAELVSAPYRELEAQYQKYSSLSESRKNTLEGVFGTGDTALSFYAAAMAHVNSLYDVLANEIHNGRDKTDEFFILRDFFEFFFSHSDYERLHTVVGTEFDSKVMVRSSTSPSQLGPVSLVLLEGYRLKDRDRVIKQSIVEQQDPGTGI